MGDHSQTSGSLHCSPPDPGPSATAQGFSLSLDLSSQSPLEEASLPPFSECVTKEWWDFAFCCSLCLECSFLQHSHGSPPHCVQLSAWIPNCRQTVSGHSSAIAIFSQLHYPPAPPSPSLFLRCYYQHPKYTIDHTFSASHDENVSATGQGLCCSVHCGITSSWWCHWTSHLTFPKWSDLTKWHWAL